MKIYVEGFDPAAISQYAEVVKSPRQADYALIQLTSPSRLILKELFGIMFRQGDLDFKPKRLQKILRLMETCPTIVSLYLDRPAVIPEIADEASAILAHFSADPAIILEAVFGEYSPSGKLPFELPRSMAAVSKQRSDVPHDSAVPVFPLGFGLSYL